MADPVSAARVTPAQITAALKRARRHHAADKAGKIRAALRADQLGRPPVVASAYAATVRTQAAILAVLHEQITAMQEQVEAHFGRHPDAEIILSQPGLGMILGARVLAEFGDDPGRYGTSRARKNYAGTSPVTHASGKKKVVMARFVHNDRLIDALGRQAYAAMVSSPGSRAFYDQQRARPRLRCMAEGPDRQLAKHLRDERPYYVGRVVSRPRSRSPVSRSVTTVVFSVEPSANAPPPETSACGYVHVHHASSRRSTEGQPNAFGCGNSGPVTAQGSASPPEQPPGSASFTGRSVPP